MAGALAARGLSFDRRLTDRPGAATDIAAWARNSGYKVAVAVGGDGTVQEIVNGPGQRAPLRQHRRSRLRRRGRRPAPLVLDLGTQVPRQRCLLVSVANGPSHAGGSKMCPEAKPDDGYLDICVAGDVTRWQTLMLLPKVFSGRHTLHPKVKVYKGVFRPTERSSGESRPNSRSCLARSACSEPPRPRPQMGKGRSRDALQ